MRELESRFRSLDRIEAPDLWNEAVMRAAELDLARRRQPSRTFVLVVAALLLALLAGAIAVGTRLIWPAPDTSAVRSANGMVVTEGGCGQLNGIDPVSGATRELVPRLPICATDFMVTRSTTWSSDGRRLAFVMSAECGGCAVPPTQEAMDEGGAWLYEAETELVEHLAPCPEMFCDAGSISPDGSMVAFVADTPVEARHALIVVDVETRSSHRLELVNHAGQPTFSPDGTRILLPILDVGRGLYTVDVTGVALGRADLPEPELLYEGADVASAAWSPDGTSIAFDWAGGRATNGVWLIAADGSGARQLATVIGGEGPSVPAWSRDGTRIAYIRTPRQAAGENSGFTLELWTVGIDGSEPALVYQSECCIGDWRPPEWSPDGEYISFGVALENGANSGTAIIRADGSDRHWLSAYPMESAWQPIPSPLPAE